LGKYVAEWQKIKANFEAEANMKRPQESVKKAIIGTVQKASGLTPALQEIDTALEKKERVTLERALNKYHSVQEPYVSFVKKEMMTYDSITQEDVVKAYAKFMREMLMIEQKVADEAKALQEAKSPGAAAIQWLFLEADVKGTVEKAKKGLGAFAALEKKYQLVKKADPAIKAAEDYTKAAARTEVANALKALKDFQAKATACAKACDPALKDKDVQKLDAYKTAVTSFQSAMSSLASSRVATQIKNLEAMG
jgi:hypothetical protein